MFDNEICFDSVIYLIDIRDGIYISATLNVVVGALIDVFHLIILIII